MRCRGGGHTARHGALGEGAHSARGHTWREGTLGEGGTLQGMGHMHIG